jgi:hypothetical protein
MLTLSTDLCGPATSNPPAKAMVPLGFAKGLVRGVMCRRPAVFGRPLEVSRLELRRGASRIHDDDVGVEQHIGRAAGVWRRRYRVRSSAGRLNSAST